MSEPSTSRAATWLARGEHFSWRPSGSADVRPVEVFHLELGDADAPPLVLVHGFPTAGIDWFDVAALLSERYRVCVLDFPGYGFSAKPRRWGYSLQRDAELLEHYLAEVLRLERVVMVAHDRGDSVALIHAARAASGEARVGLNHLALSNANIFLPLSQLTDAQRVMLHEPQMLEHLTPELLAAGMGALTFTPPRSPEDPEVQALAAAFAHEDGIGVLHETVQYLVERSQEEETWLRALAATDLPTTLIWGLYDTIAPPRVATHVWHHHLMFKPGANAFYLIPAANHYLQNDRPAAFVQALLHALDAPADAAPGALSEEPGAPLLVDRSRSELPDAAGLLARQG